MDRPHPSPLPEGEGASGGRLAANVMHFARLLRRAGLPVGAAESVAASRALALIDIGDRRQAHAALRAVMVHRHEHHEVFDHAFALFWRDPTAAIHAAMMSMLGDKAPPQPQKQTPGQRRVAEAMATKRDVRPAEDRPPELDATMTVSDREQLQTMDFEQMSAAEIAGAKSEIRRLRLPLDLRRTRRLRPGAPGDPAAAVGRAV